MSLLRLTPQLPRHAPPWLSLGSLGVSSATRAMTAKDTADESKPTQKKLPRILCAEDNPNLRTLLSHVLSAAGYAVEFAPDGQHAFDQLMSRPDAFDLLITDHQMPGGDGLALVTQLRQAAFSGRVIVLSSQLSTRDLASYRALSVDSILTKPTNNATLTKTIEAVCNDTRRNA